MSQCRNTLETGSYVVGGPFCWPVIVACKMHGPMALRATIGIVGQISWFVIASLLINYFSELISPAATMEDGGMEITAIIEASTTEVFSTTPIPTTTQPTTMWIGNIIWILSQFTLPCLSYLSYLPLHLPYRALSYRALLYRVISCRPAVFLV